MHKHRRRRPGSTRDRFAADSSGAVAIMAALLFPVLVGGMALGAEASYWYLSKSKLQQASDLSAHAAAVQLRSGRSAGEILAAATDIAKASDFRAGDDVLVVSHPPTSGARAGDPKAVEIRLTRQQVRFFTLIYATDTVEISARAVAELRGGGNACLLSLDPTVSGAISLSGSAEVTFEGCDVATNSNAADAFSMSGGKVEMTAGCVHSVGGVDATGGLQLKCPAPVVQAPAIRDPYADIHEPAVTGTCEAKNLSSGTVTPTHTHALGIPSRRFCGGLDIKGNVTFSPGLYIVDGGSFSVNGNSDVVGVGVTFLLANGATLNLNGNASFDLTAPSSGPLAGLLFFGDRSKNVTHSINGNAGSKLNGAVYLPAGDLDYSGNFSGSNGCTQIVARRMTFTGNSSLTVNCSAAGTRRIPVAQTIALVE